MSKNRCHEEIHYERSPDSQHIRLISEGGTSRAGCPDLVCIDSIQIAQTCTSESTVFRPATGACTMFPAPDTALFSIPGSHAAELDRSLVPAVLRRRLDQQGLHLSDQARVDVRHPGKVWLVSDQENWYCIRKLVEHLTVYRHAR